MQIYNFFSIREAFKCCIFYNFVMLIFKRDSSKKNDKKQD